MSTLSPALTKELRQTLLRCGPFGNLPELRAAFVDTRIAPWRGTIPEGGNEQARVDLMIAALLERQNARGEHALVLFLRVLADRIDPNDACHPNLAALAGKVERELGGPVVSGPTSTPISTQQLRQILNDHFSQTELQTLAFELGINYDDLEGTNRATKIIALIGFLQRRNRLNELISAMRNARPDLNL